MRTHLRRSLGLARTVAHLTRGAVTMAVVMPLAGPERQRRIVQRWARGVLDIFGLDLHVDGTPPGAHGARPVLLVGNHVSWLDIYAYLAVTDVRFVAKSEVRSWPLIGWFATRLGTIFVERDRLRDAVRVGDEIKTALGAGQTICVFPEGTTTDGSVVLPFSAALLSPAVAAEAHVHPVAIAYRAADGQRCSRVAFTGDATLVESIWALTAGGRTRVELRFLDPIAASGLDRRGLTRRAETAVRASLGLASGAAAADGPAAPSGAPIAA
jgi:1-acyl-sn-glycerol-3-phosphate acyltransferase